VRSTNVQEDVDAIADHPANGAALDELEELKQAESDQPTAGVPVVIVPAPRQTEPCDEPMSPQRKHVLEHLMSMADQYARNGSLRQAVELYFALATDHQDSEQAVQSCDRLMAIAQRYENHGELRLARGIYERLLKVS